MKAFAQTRNPMQRTNLASSRRSNEVNCAYRQHLITRNRPVQRLLQAGDENHEGGLLADRQSHYTYDFSRISLYAKTHAEIQPKLRIGTPGDAYEQEADYVADQLMRMPKQKLQHASCEEECPKRQLEKLNHKQRISQIRGIHGDYSGNTMAPPIVQDVLSSSGQPLDITDRALFEPFFAYDLANVVLHTDKRALESAKAINALAYTSGNHIVFGFNQHSLNSESRKSLLAHEITHVLQQNQGLFSPQIQLSPSDSDPSERMMMGHRSIETAGLERERGFALQRLEPTEWEQRIASNADYRPIFEDNGTLLLGYYRSFGGYEEIYDREGTTVWTDEIGIETPLISPIDLLGPSVIMAGGRIGIRFVGRFIARFAARQVAQGIGRATAEETALGIIARLRQIAMRLITRSAAGGSEALLQSLVRRAQDTLVRFFARLLASGTSEAITVEGVTFGGVRVTVQGAELIVTRVSIINTSRIAGQGRLIHRAFEQAAAQVARQVNVRTARVNLEYVINQEWANYLRSQGYAWISIPNESGGFINVMTKIFSL